MLSDNLTKDNSNWKALKTDTVMPRSAVMDLTAYHQQKNIINWTTLLMTNKPTKYLYETWLQYIIAHNRNPMKLRRLPLTQKNHQYIYLTWTLCNNCQNSTDYQNYTNYIFYMPMQPVTSLLNNEYFSNISLTCRCVCHHCSNKCLLLFCNWVSA